MLSNPLNKESVLMIKDNEIQEEINFEQLNKLKNQIINEQIEKSYDIDP